MFIEAREEDKRDTDEDGAVDNDVTDDDTTNKPIYGSLEAASAKSMISGPLMKLLFSDSE